MTQQNQDWIAFRPPLEEHSGGWTSLLAFARDLAGTGKLEKEARLRAVERHRKVALSSLLDCPSKDRQTFAVAVNVLADLAKQGWSVAVNGEGMAVSRPRAAEGLEETRTQVRDQLHAERDAQLLQPATWTFVREMEAKRYHQGGFVSIFSLMRDGADLAAGLRALRDRDTADQAEGLSRLVQPYLQFVIDESRCPYTGLRLVDIWRYFRHTWANPYKSVPGRGIMVLVRDAATSHHPVLGIAALNSAAVAVAARDEFIGWTPASVLAEMEERPSVRLAQWLSGTVDQAVEEIYKVDFLQDSTLTLAQISDPCEKTLERLYEVEKTARAEHNRYMQSSDYKKGVSTLPEGEERWEEQARTPLFRSKRAGELAQLLSVRRVFRKFFSDRPAKNALRQLAADREGKDAVAKVVRRAKAERVGIAIADLTVCGAIPPYNELVAGKLVSLLMASPDVVREYRRRYGASASIIASSMAGRPVVRPAHLVYLGTTSLYGQRPSQYDRIAFGLARGKADRCLRYQYLGRTKGLGTFQFSEETVAQLALLLAQSHQGQRVNSVFGEGVNPRLRKIRDGLDLLELDSDQFLDHGAPRLVYGAPLIANLRDYLLGGDAQPRYLLPPRGADIVPAMVQWWIERWALSRIARDDVLERFGGDRLTHPIRHRARVPLPEREEEGTPFD